MPLMQFLGLNGTFFLKVEVTCNILCIPNIFGPMIYQTIINTVHNQDSVVKSHYFILISTYKCNISTELSEDWNGPQDDKYAYTSLKSGSRLKALLHLIERLHVTSKDLEKLTPSFQGQLTFP